MRAFVAIELPRELLEKIRLCQNGLLAKGVLRGFVRPEHIHLTLKFLGNVERERVSAIASALQRAAFGFKPFMLSTGDIGGFPNLKAPRVVWVGIKDSAPLVQLAAHIDGRLNELGYPKEARPFRPHLTLLRTKTPDEALRAGALASEGVCDVNMDFKADSFVLFESRLIPKGPEYTALNRITLGGCTPGIRGGEVTH